MAGVQRKRLQVSRRSPTEGELSVNDQTHLMKKQWIALLRGITPPGRVHLPMSEIPAVFEANGLEDAKTCLENGNIVFSAREGPEQLQEHLKTVLKDNFQLRAKFCLIEATRYKTIVQENPFESATRNTPENVHVFFLRKRPVTPNFEQMERFKSPAEEWSLTDFALYLHTPNEFRLSQLGVRTERLLGVSTTRRTWSEVSHILDALD